MFNIYEQKPPKQLPTSPPFGGTTSSGSQASWKQFPPNPYQVQRKKIKFICSFGGAFLPRPSDGELRYVGGERHLLRIDQDMSWRELTCKTTKLIRQDHTIKYHLPGEQLNMLISITSDDDLRNMIDECIVLEASRERLTMYLFSTNEDEHGVRFLVARSSSEAEKEAHFIALVNGLATPIMASRMQNLGSTSASDLDQVMLGAKEDRLPASLEEEYSMHIKGKPLQKMVVELPKTSSEPLEKTIPTPKFLTRKARKDNAQNREGNLITSGRNVHFGPSVQSESMHAATRGTHSDQGVSKHQPGLQQTTTTITGKGHQATGSQEKGSLREELLIPLDNSSVNISSSSSSNSSPTPQTNRSVFDILESSSRGSQKTVNQQTSSDNNKMRPERNSTQESHSAAEPPRNNKNFQLHNKVDIPEHSTESASPMQCHDDMDLSSNLHILEKSDATNSMKQQQPAIPNTCGNTPEKGHSPKPTSNSSETLLSGSFASSDKTTELKPNTLVRALSERQQERPNEQTSKVIKSRSVGANSPQNIVVPQEAKDNIAPLISEHEVHLHISFYMLI